MRDWNAMKASGAAVSARRERDRLLLIVAVVVGVIVLVIAVAAGRKKEPEPPMPEAPGVLAPERRGERPAAGTYTPVRGGPHCTKGCRCGNSCIDCSKTCRK